MIQRIALGIEYDGSRYCGWQDQGALPTIQTTLEQALSKVAGHEVRVNCAGRTDIAVHATGQVVHFETTAQRKERNWLLGTNTNLPNDIAIKWVQLVEDEFHARFSALSRRYRYIIYNSPTPSSILHKGLTWFYHPLQAHLMHEAAQYLLGEQDFTSFRASGCQSKSALRNVHACSVERRGDFVIIDITANAFLYHMVRNIAGVLLKIGIKNQPPSWMREVLDAQDRKLAAVTAPATGLYLVEVTYPEKFNIPKANLGPLNF